MTEERVYEPCTSQAQADMFHHAAHDPEYAASRKLTTELAEGKLAATIAAGKWGKSEGSPCPKCHPDCEHGGCDISDDGHCENCGGLVYGPKSDKEIAEQADAADGQPQGDPEAAVDEAKDLF